MTKYIIAAALFAFCLPAWAGGSHNGGGAVGSTHASSTSDIQAGGTGKSSASTTFSNKSRAENRDGASITSSESTGKGKSKGESSYWDGIAGGAANAWTLGGFDRH